MRNVSPRLTRQIQFILELDRLKQVLRATRLTDDARRENSAEHSWHLATMALVLAEYAPAAVDVTRVLQMLLVHDVVEIDAGDTFAYDLAANGTKAARELAAAERLFGLLPAEQGQALRALWDEFEAGSSAEARFANALDRLQPLLLNVQNRGGSWQEHQVTRVAVLARMAPVQHGTPELWPFVLEVVEWCCAQGYIVG